MKLLALLAAALASQPDPPLAPILARVAEEAEIFSHAALDLTAEETLQQRARITPRHFRPRLGKAAAQPPKPEYQTRQVVSEYGFATFKEAPGVIHELRQVVSVDGRRIATPEKARQSLVRGLHTQDDRVKKRMLEQFRRFGFDQAATDFGQLILLFGSRRQSDFHFRITRSDRLGADQAVVVDFQQKAGGAGLVIFQGASAIRERLDGEIWVRQGDWLPLRITLRASRKLDQALVRDEASVDYAMSPHAVLTPVAVLHRQFAGQDLVVENLFRYTAFRKFAAQADVKYD